MQMRKLIRYLLCRFRIAGAIAFLDSSLHRTNCSTQRFKRACHVMNT